MKDAIKVHLKDFLVGAKIFVPIVAACAAIVAMLYLFIWGASPFPLTAVTIVVVNICIGLGAYERRDGYYKT
jgi:hypothetical protein